VTVERTWTESMYFQCIFCVFSVYF